MSPPNAPGIPGTRLPETWESKAADFERRLRILEEHSAAARTQLQSYNDIEEDSQVKIPSDAPKLAKAGLGALSGLTPTGRAWVIGVLGLAVILAGAVLLAMRVLHL